MLVAAELTVVSALGEEEKGKEGEWGEEEEEEEEKGEEEEEEEEEYTLCGPFLPLHSCVHLYLEVDTGAVQVMKQEEDSFLSWCDLKGLMQTIQNVKKTADRDNSKVQHVTAVATDNSLVQQVQYVYTVDW